MKLFRFVVKRVWVSLIMLFLLVTISFFMVKLIPGSPFTSDKMQAGNKAAIYAYYGLDKPVWQQYFVYMGNLLQGNLGTSYKIRAVSVNQIILSAFPYSLDLGLRALGFALTMGLLLGILAAYQRGRAMDSFSMVVAIIGTSVPSFIVGFFIQYFFAVKLKWFPVAQYESFAHTVLPTFALGLGMLATIAKYTRTSMLEVISSDFVKTADAKGLSKPRIILVHQLRNALMPVVTLLGADGGQRHHGHVRRGERVRDPRAGPSLRHERAEPGLHADHGADDLLRSAAGFHEPARGRRLRADRPAHPAGMTGAS